jgi:hypothetical protein
MQGWRTSMEDAHCAELNADGEGSSFFGVYDGALPHQAPPRGPPTVPSLGLARS